MMEVRIECLCKEYEVVDLGLKLVKGDVKWLPKAQADASSELKHAVRIKALGRREVDRGTKPAEQTPPWLRRRGAKPPVQRPRRTAPPVAPAPVPAPSEPAPKGLTEAEFRRIAREEITRAMRGAAPTTVNVAPAAITRDDLADVMREVLGGLPTASPPTQPTASSPTQPTAPAPDDDDEIDGSEPMFIPSSLSKPSDEKADIKVESGEATGDESFAAAKAALKATAKPQRKRRTRKKKPTTKTSDGDAG